MAGRIYSPYALGVILRAARKRKMLTQTQAAKMAGVGQDTISRVESGNPGTTVDTLFRLMSALELDLFLEEKKPIEPSSVDW